MRPLRPHPDRRDLFSQNQKRCSFGQCAVPASDVSLQILDPSFPFLGRPAQTRCPRAVPVIRLFARGLPYRDLRRIKPTLTAVFAQISLVQYRRFQHRRELVARRSTLRASISGRQKRHLRLPLPLRLSTPLVKRRIGNTFLLRKLPNGHVVRRKHPLQRSQFSFW
jgi:hypothetical protein